MLDRGYPVYPETGQGLPSNEFDKLSQSDQYAELEKADTWVIEFPIATKATQKASDESALAQYARYLFLQEQWSDHNTSITISVGDDEWDALFDKIHNSWDKYIGISFIPKDKNIYPLMPYESITEEEYNNRLQVIDSGDIYAALTLREMMDLASDLLDDSCESGYCPVR